MFCLLGWCTETVLHDKYEVLMYVYIYIWLYIYMYRYKYYMHKPSRPFSFLFHLYYNTDPFLPLKPSRNASSRACVNRMSSSLGMVSQCRSPERDERVECSVHEGQDKYTFTVIVWGLLIIFLFSRFKRRYIMMTYIQGKLPNFTKYEQLWNFVGNKPVFHSPWKSSSRVESTMKFL